MSEKQNKKEEAFRQRLVGTEEDVVVRLPRKVVRPQEPPPASR